MPPSLSVSTMRMSMPIHTTGRAARFAEMLEKYRRGEFMDDTVPPICGACKKEERPGQLLIRCSGCNGVQYCDAKCATYGLTSGHPTQLHRNICATIKECVAKRPAMQEIARQFPWARQQADGTFSFDLLRAAKGIFGVGPEFGWWTESPFYSVGSRYVWGFWLLEEEHLQESEGWKLPVDQIPWLDFAASSSGTPPTMERFEHSWPGYYKWRGLPMESLAVFLLQWPLTIFKLLYLLGLAPPDPPKERRQLTVHLLGVETELDFLPVFGELALLLPNTDLDLVLFGTGLGGLKAQVDSRSCLAARPFVYTYAAPEVSGEGKVRIALSPSGLLWDGMDVARLRNEKPDAIVALNAGLGAYLEWLPVLYASRALAIPFAVTDYLEISLDTNVRILKRLGQMQQGLWPVVGLTGVEQKRLWDAQEEEYRIELNPFMCPGPRPQALDVGPSAVNGHVMVITPGL